MYNNLILIKKISEGLSQNEKYLAENENHQRFLIKLYDTVTVDHLNRFKVFLYELQQQDIPAQQILECGVDVTGRTYAIYKWIDGCSIDQMVGVYSPEQMYWIGYKSGTILKKIHRSKIRDMSIASKCSLTERLERDMSVLSNFEQNNRETYYSNIFAEYLRSNIKKITYDDSCVLHGDYHMKNMICNSTRQIWIIDWECDYYDNPMMDLIRAIVSADSCPEFASGEIDGYLQQKPTEDFWIKLKFFTALHMLEILKYCFPPIHNNTPFIKYQQELVIQQYDCFRALIPNYYYYKGARK